MPAVPLQKLVKPPFGSLKFILEFWKFDCLPFDLNLGNVESIRNLVTDPAWQLVLHLRILGFASATLFPDDASFNPSFYIFDGDS